MDCSLTLMCYNHLHAEQPVLYQYVNLFKFRIMQGVEINSADKEIK
jgi:hypothetical protein